MIERDSGLQDVLSILQPLVQFDTRNPPRQISAGDPLFHYLREQIGPSFEFEITDHQQGRISLFCVRGTPRVLFNVHLDTVPADASQWSQHPLQATVAEGRVMGRGVCDIKGAAACLISVARHVDADMAILFTTDEEGSQNCCVRRFCETPRMADFELAVVAEPTGCRAVTAHRGYLSVQGHFRSRAGHSSSWEQLDQGAVHRAIRWAGQAMELARRLESESGGQSLCFNIGNIQGGTKNNMIASECQLSWSIRVPAGWSNESFLEKLPPPAEPWTISFHGPSLPATAQQREFVEAWIASRCIPLGDAVDFWTEASLFSAAGLPSLVLGPGNIAQAHTVDEWVALDQLAKARDLYESIARRQSVEA